MRFPPSLLDEIRARLPVSQVVSRRVALKRHGREFIGLSPFKTEKTPSFTVNDKKGFYHCFSSGEHGDIFRFLMVTEGLSFPEAVERLAAEAGVPLPKPSPELQQMEDRRERLLALNEAACRWFEQNLSGAQGRQARAYLEGRAIASDLSRRFRMGFAPDSRNALKDFLAGKGYSGEEMAEAGVVVAGPDIPVSYDRFRGRLIIPITDMRGRVIAFGGRALAPEAKPKYLNSPETPLFHKGATLFNAASARTAAHDSGAVVVVEGYMDVVALVGAGIAHAVAPLGTALTEDQLRLLWRLAAEPILCFDGDTAGRKAAYRAIELVLPHLKPGFSLTFAFLPQGLDPDDLVRQEGPEAVRRLLASPRPLVDVLWQRELESADVSTPERRARLEQRLMTLAGQIGDITVRNQYQRLLRDRLWQLWGGRSKPAQAPRGPLNRRAGGERLPAQRAIPSASLIASNRIASSHGDSADREVLLLRCMLNHPWLIDDWAEEIAGLSIRHPALAGLRDIILQVHAARTGGAPLDRDELSTHLQGLGCGDALALIARATTHRSDRFAEPDAHPAEVGRGWQHTLLLQRKVELMRALSDAELALRSDMTDENFARLNDLRRRLQEGNSWDGTPLDETG